MKRISKALSVFTSHSFYVRIVTAFVGLLILTVLPILSYNYYKNTNIALESSDDLMNQTTMAVIEKTTNFLMPASVTVQMSARLTESGVISCTDTPQLELFTFGVLKSYPQICMFFLGDEQGNYIRSWLLPNGNVESRIIQRNVSPPTDLIKYCDPLCKVLRAEQTADIKYDPRDRPWYQGAKEARGIFWTDLYILFRNQKPAVTSAYPVTDHKGNLLGVWGMDIELEEISNFLAKLKIGKNGIVFIVNHKNEVVAYPDASRIVIKEKEILRPIQVEELGSDSITAVFQEYRRSGQSKLAVESQGRRFLASLREFPRSFGAPWKVAVVVPEEDFIGMAQRIIRNTLFICLAILLIAILLAILLARSISRPINQLTAAAKKIKDFHLEGKISIRSYIKEIQLMGQAIGAMQSGLLAFRRYVPAELVRQLIQTGEEAHLGGQKRELTVFFSDIAGFTPIAERLGPEALMLHLSEYFDELTRILTAQKGTVDKYIGDSIMAFWGAPLPDPEHARYACDAALLCRERLKELNEKWVGEGKPALATRIGISTGETVVGNVGSSERINYTVMGDNVNLASRLEGVNRIYGTQILVTQATYEQAADHFWFRQLGIIAVKGKTAETTIYELMERKNGGETSFAVELCAEFHRGVKAYLDRDWAGAGEIFQRLSEKFPGDAPTNLYRSRCRLCQDNPPGPDWRGITYLDAK